jgi:DNA gyrase/topoisomerase IV subunit A
MSRTESARAEMRANSQAAVMSNIHDDGALNWCEQCAEARVYKKLDALEETFTVEEARRNYAQEIIVLKNKRIRALKDKLEDEVAPLREEIAELKEELRHEEARNSDIKEGMREEIEQLRTRNEGLRKSCNQLGLQVSELQEQIRTAKLLALSIIPPCGSRR